MLLSCVNVILNGETKLIDYNGNFSLDILKCKEKITYIISFFHHFRDTEHINLYVRFENHVYETGTMHKFIG